MSSLDNYLANLDRYSSGYESAQGPEAIMTQKSDPLQKSALQPAAQFTIRIDRDNTNLTGPVPAAIFGWNKYFTQYVERLGDATAIPASAAYDGMLGGIVSASPPSTALASTIRFSFTEAATTTLLDVTCDENPYPEVLAATGFTPMLVNKIRMSLSDETQTSQFNQGIKVIRSSTFGKITTQTIVPATQKSPMQFQAGIVDLIDYPMVVDAQTFLVVPIIRVASFQVALSFEVQAFSRPLEA